jgi:hypothetical protein
MPLEAPVTTASGLLAGGFMSLLRPNRTG